MSAEKAMNMRRKVQALQSKLSCAAKQSLSRKFGALYDKIYREDVLRMAWQRVRANKGAPGIDRQSIEYIEDEIGVEAFLKEIGEELREKRYRPLPVRRCWIDKPGKGEKRPLGIPVVKDRVIQMATKLVIEPIFEANFLSCSYGFRPGVSAHKAIKRIQKTGQDDLQIDRQRPESEKDKGPEPVGPSGYEIELETFQAQGFPGCLRLKKGSLNLLDYSGTFAVPPDSLINFLRQWSSKEITGQ